MNLQKLNSTLVLLLVTFIFCGVAIYNGYPLVYPDTGAYIGLDENFLRSYFYNLFLAPALWAHTLWVVVVIQSLIAAHLLRLVLRVVFGLTSMLAVLGVLVPLGLLSTLPWFTGFIMPDIFTGVLILSLFLLIFCPSQLSLGEKIYLVALVIVAVTVHFSHIPLALGVLTLALIFKVMMRGKNILPSPSLWHGIIAVAVALVLLVANGYRSYGILTISPSGYAFLLARLVADGPAVQYLRDKCPEQKYALCDYLDQMPADSDEFLWPLDSPFRKVGWVTGYREEGQKIVMGTILHNPAQIGSLVLSNTFRQIPMINNWYGIAPYLDKSDPTDAIKVNFPGDFGAYASSRQNQNTLGLSRFNRLHLLVISLCLPLAAAVFCFYLKRRLYLQLTFLISLACAYGLSAFITAALAVPHNRYGSRLIWLLPFFCLAAVPHVIKQLKNSKK